MKEERRFSTNSISQGKVLEFWKLTFSILCPILYTVYSIDVWYICIIFLRKYFAIKEQLKYYVIKLVREKFMYTSSFDSKEEMQDFISELYQFLIDKMHVGMNRYLSTEETTEVPPQIADSSMLLHFAQVIFSGICGWSVFEWILSIFGPPKGRSYEFSAVSQSVS